MIVAAYAYLSVWCILHNKYKKISGSLGLEIDIFRQNYAFVTALFSIYFQSPLEQKWHYMAAGDKKKERNVFLVHPGGLLWEQTCA